MLRWSRGRAATDLAAAREGGLLDELVRDGLLLPFEDAGEGLVRQETLPFVSYPYEWPFAMLRDAALLHLDVLERSLRHGFTLTDGSAYNVQFRGTRPVFIDLGSFVRHDEGAPWSGYAQFCRHFLGPLLIAAYGRVPYQPWLRASLDGIAPADVSAALGLRDKLRPSVFTNVVLQSFLSARTRDLDPAALGNRVRVPREALLRQVRGLRRTIARLRSRRRRSDWIDYERARSYTAEGLAVKAAAVSGALESTRPDLVLDLGTNRGEYALLAARAAGSVVAIDGDETGVDDVYVRARADGSRVLPLVMDLANPSPDQGWAERERQGLRSRGSADLVMALALVHHLRISVGAPVRAILDWLAELAPAALIEFVPKTDPMVRRLLAWREDVFDDYELDLFERALADRFAIRERVAVPGSERVLYRAERR